jgi:hypothetical protein
MELPMLTNPDYEQLLDPPSSVTLDPPSSVTEKHSDRMRASIRGLPLK